MVDTSCEYDDRKVMWVSTDERRMITRMMKLAAQYPDEVEIIARPENNDGCLYMKCPANWLFIRHPRKVEMSEERKEAMREQLRRWRNQPDDLPFDENDEEFDDEEDEE